MVQTDKRLLWHPRYDNRFVVGGNSQITLYEWAAEYPEIRHVTSQHDLQFMKCFAWSPDPSFDDLIAVGLSTGKVDLIRLEAGKHAQRKNVLSSGPTVTLPVRNSRSCNALAFSNEDPNYLAVGLDKVRGDSSLIIWDISTFAPALALPVPPSGDPNNNNGIDNIALSSLSSILPHHPFPPRVHPQLPRNETPTRIDSRIIQQHAPTEIVSSLAFLPKSTHLLLAGISHRWLRLFDLRAPAMAPINVASKVHGIATDPYDPHRIACFGDAVVNVWDIRQLRSGAPVLTFSEKDAGRMVPKWWLRGGGSYATIEFSNTRRGVLTTLERDASYVRFWDLQESRVGVLDGSFTSAGGGASYNSDGETKSLKDSIRSGARKSWAANLPWPSSADKSGSPAPQQQQTSPKEKDGETGQLMYVLADTRRTKAFTKPLSSFALVPNPRTPHPLTTNVMVVNKDGDLELYAIHDSPKQIAWSTRGDMASGAGAGLWIMEGRGEGLLGLARSGRDGERMKRAEDGRKGTSSAFWQAQAPFFGRGDEDGFPASLLPLLLLLPTGLSATRPGKPRTYSPSSVRTLRYTGTAATGSRSRSRRKDQEGKRYRDYGAGVGGTSNSAASGIAAVTRVVQDDISMVMRRRAKAGMGSPQHNISLWAWIYHSQEVLCLPTPRLHGYDFSYQGLLGIWDGFAPMSVPASATSTHTHNSQRQGQGAVVGDSLGDESQRSLLLDSPFGLNASQASSRQGHSGSTTGSSASTATLTSAAPSFASNGSSSSTATTTTANTTGIMASTSLAPPINLSHSGSGSSSNSKSDSRRSRSPLIRDSNDLHGNWAAALTLLAARRGGVGGGNERGWKPPVSTSRLAQRQIGLQLCGWSLREEEVGGAIQRWEKEGKLSRAACWLVFTGQYGKAVELLMRSDDETHQMMSGTVAALAPFVSSSSTSRSLDLREHYGRLIIRLQDPYFRIMLTHLATGDWNDVLEEDSLSSYLKRTVERACVYGDIEALIITGLTPLGMNVLQAYVDRTGDVQSVAILSAYVSPSRFWDRRVERWRESYRDLLDGWRLHHLRVGFDIERGQILSEAAQSGEGLSGGKMGVSVEDWAPRQILIRCHYCNKPVSNLNKAQPKGKNGLLAKTGGGLMVSVL
ncbi:hypothetical protein CPB84DRAFT_1813441 [Gymnopilus junonius]|uniref:MIOS-like alpha-solenoid domain-containing protein n=1 Tax=Gymnopilus junonius TaxID=109634 RepID=A0A9P5TRQ4_GYMJU|nr:hypothetical protein CPB84DRAFT_1813441 [Gymnopilus junonius]